MFPASVELVVITVHYNENNRFVRSFHEIHLLVIIGPPHYAEGASRSINNKEIRNLYHFSVSSNPWPPKVG